MEERRRGCFVATEAPPPLLGLVAIAFCHRQAAVLPPRRSKGCLAAVVLCRQAVVSPLITIIVSSVTRGNMNSEEAAQILRRTTRDMLQVSYVVSKGTDRDLRTKFKGIRDLCGGCSKGSDKKFCKHD
ncbi:uncharacterized protein LOC130943740 isoform X2 [Arachis stenosperma]|uniref:uncharacterized protein LOC130943740 isoform X2 n=1 Tax=Arachis stenosperma TaxID=217475 RepID=UPI0025AD78AE|nr:uncharacterized protein LOC130943740 isoform X2 [Arachis stenosperma]